MMIYYQGVKTQKIICIIIYLSMELQGGNFMSKELREQMMAQKQDLLNRQVFLLDRYRNSTKDGLRNLYGQELVRISKELNIVKSLLTVY